MSKRWGKSLLYLCLLITPLIITRAQLRAGDNPRGVLTNVKCGKAVPYLYNFIPLLLLVLRSHRDAGVVEPGRVSGAGRAQRAAGACRTCRGTWLVRVRVTLVRVRVRVRIRVS